MRYKNVCLNLPEAMLARLDAEAAVAQRSRSFLVREIIQRHFDTNTKPYQAGDHSRDISISSARMNALHETTPAEKESLHVV
jgi:predicted DNA-binding protein